MTSPITVKKGILGVIIGFVGIIFIGVLSGLYYLNHRHLGNADKAASKVQQVAGNEQMDWAHTEAEKAQKAEKAAVLDKAPLKTTAPVTVSPVLPASAALPSPDKAAEAVEKARLAPISAQQISIPLNDNDTTSHLASPSLRGAGVSPVGALSDTDQNRQAEKKAFLDGNTAPNLKDDYLNASVQSPLSPYEIQAGSLIPGMVLTGINSDLPGQITGQVQENVYDSPTGRYLLIPQGAKLIGLYDSQVVYGQERVLIAWKRILFPNGKSLDLAGMPGVDLSGYAGFQDQVNNHYGKMFGAVLLMTLLGAGPALAQPHQTQSIFSVMTPTIGQTLAQSLGTNIANVGTQITQKNLNVQPTLDIRPGYTFYITVTKDMVFPGVYTP